ncbi:MAG: hypothetical protein JOZ24_01765 [Candidatus Eremiobacteraeota bacterium]|nr:hypothetical protein [Candidatus Eremiobacteraeota bacterium]
MNWLRRVDPAFYYKEPSLLHAQAQIARYTEAAQAEVRVRVLAEDTVVHAVTTLIALATYVAATGAGRVELDGQWLAAWGFAVLAAGVPSALEWSSDPEGRRSWRDALLGVALVLIPAAWTHRIDLALAGTALATGIALFLARGSLRVIIVAAAVGVLFGMRASAHPFPAAPLVIGFISAGAGSVIVMGIAAEWRARPQVVTWAAFGVVVLACAYAFAFDGSLLSAQVPVEIASVAVAYLGVCVLAARIRRAELLARPGGVLTIPQSIVPLLNRSHHHAVIARTVD